MRGGFLRAPGVLCGLIVAEEKHWVVLSTQDAVLRSFLTKASGDVRSRKLQPHWGAAVFDRITDLRDKAVAELLRASFHVEDSESSCFMSSASDPVDDLGFDEEVCPQKMPQA